MHSPHPQVAALLIRKLVDHLVEYGVPRAALLETAGIAPPLFVRHRLRLPWVLVEDLLEAAASLTDDDRLGFHIARQHDLETLGLPGLLFFASGTVGTAIRRLAMGARLWSNAYTLVLEEGATESWYRFILHRPPRPALAHLCENHLATLSLVGRQLLGTAAPLLEVRFPHPRSGDLSEYLDWFKCPVHFHTGEAAARISSALLKAPMPTANRLFASHFETQLRDALNAIRAPETTTSRLRSIFAEELAANRLSNVSIEQVASVMRASSRSLQRALRREQTSFRAELATFRRAEAERMLLNGVDIAEISWRLGYSESSVFHRAFKRWTRQTPEDWRNNQ